MKKRDLKADRELCKNATQGPWEAGYYNSVSTSQGVKLCNVIGGDNAKFIAEAREGWPHAIERAIEAETLNRELIDVLDVVLSEDSIPMSKWLESKEQLKVLHAKAKEVLRDE